MNSRDYLEYLVNEIHSVVVATIGADGRPSTRVIDMMLCDDQGLYFLTAKGKDFYHQLTEQRWISLSCIKNKRSISLQGSVENIGTEKLEEIFEKNPYMQDIYPEGSRHALEVFRIHNANGEFFDISNPKNVTRGAITIGNSDTYVSGYLVDKTLCIGCGTCLATCPQKAISLDNGKAFIDQNHCLHCGLCAEACPQKAITKRS